MGKIRYILLSLVSFCFIAKAQGNGYSPKISFKDVIESQAGVIKKVINLNKKVKEQSNKVDILDKNVSKLQTEQDTLSQKVSNLEKEIKEIKLENSLKGLVIENTHAHGKLGFGKVSTSTPKQIIKNGPENVYFCVEGGVSYIHKYPSAKSVAIGASYKGDRLQCLTPCGLEGNKYYWLHILNLRTGYKGYSILDKTLKEGKCK